MTPRAPALDAAPTRTGRGLALGRPALTAWCAALVAVLTSGCIVVPRTADVYSERCQTTVRQVVLETEVIGALGSCRNDGCAVMLASMGIISAASAVVSGSVAIIGNIAHWVERGGECPRATPSPSSPAPPVVATGTPPPAAAAPATGPLPRPPIVPGIQPLPPTAPAASPAVR
jgi:hypothetical protein